MTGRGREYMGRVAQLPCAICGIHGVHVHHIRTGVGMGRRASDFDSIEQAIQSRKAWERHHGITELQLLEQTKEALA